MCLLFIWAIYIKLYNLFKIPSIIIQEYTNHISFTDKKIAITDSISNQSFAFVGLILIESAMLCIWYSQMGLNSNVLIDNFIKFFDNLYEYHIDLICNSFQIYMYSVLCFNTVLHSLKKLQLFRWWYEII